MAVNNAFPLYNGFAVSWADISVKITGTDIVLLSTEDIAAVHTGRTIEVGQQRGATGGRKKKRTLGSAEQEASITLYRDGYQKFLRTLVATAEAQGYVRGNEVLISPVSFDMQILHTPFNDPEIYDRRVLGARVIGDTLDGAEGTDADQVEVPLDVMKIVDMIDGKEVVLL